MTLQYARLFQLRAGIQLIGESDSMSKEELTEALRQRKTIDADETATEGADDIIEQLCDANLIKNSGESYRLTSEEEFKDKGVVLTYSGEEVVGRRSAGSSRPNTREYHVPTPNVARPLKIHLPKRPDQGLRGDAGI